MKLFADRLIAWQKRYGRHQLPWQQTKNPYHIWVSEIMLQQTQAETVKGYYERFITRFPSVEALAKADFDEVIRLWAGLGYYARARNLHKAAIQIMATFHGRFPKRLSQLESLPGIGRSTAAAITAFAFDVKTTILDGNVKRILSRYFAISDEIDSAKTTQKLWILAEQLVPNYDITHYIQGLMDLGSLVCKRSRPACQNCPVHEDCAAYLTNSTHSYPVRKKAKTKPIRAAIFLILQSSDRRILLEKRPNKGIWSGLWCFPSIDIDPKSSITTIMQTASNHLQEDFHNLRLLPAFQHVFTHFKLQVYPIICEQAVKQDKPLYPHQCWHLPDEAQHIGIPKPTSDLLKQIFHCRL